MPRQSPIHCINYPQNKHSHQSLLATRVRTRDLLKVADATSVAMAGAYSLENWGGATFDVSMRSVRRCAC